MLGLTPDDLDFQLVLGSNTFRVSKYLFAAVCGRLYEDRAALYAGRLIVDGDYPPDVFKIFCDACQSVPFLITEQNCFELQRIAHDFRVPTLENAVSEYIEKEADNPAVLLHKWNFCARFSLDNTETEAQLARNLDRALDLPDFAPLPIEPLERIVGNPEQRLENVQ
jgi:hypothetical protein